MPSYGNISIVTGTLNRLEHVQRLIGNTVMADERLELVLVDGGSSDGTLDFLRLSKPPRTKVIEVGMRSSYPHYMNIGVRASTHELVCQWNDDVLLVNPWQDVFDAIDNHHDFYLFNWKPGDLADIHNHDWLRGHDRYHGWCLCDKAPEGEVVMNYGVYKKDVFRRCGLYDTSYNYYYCDGDMAHRAFCRGMVPKDCWHIKVLSVKSEKRAFEREGELSHYKARLDMHKANAIPSTVEVLE